MSNLHFPLYFTAPTSENAQPTHTHTHKNWHMVYLLQTLNPRCIPYASPLKSSIGILSKSKKTVVALKKTGMSSLEKYSVQMEEQEGLFYCETNKH